MDWLEKIKGWFGKESKQNSTGQMFYVGQDVTPKPNITWGKFNDKGEFLGKSQTYPKFGEVVKVTGYGPPCKGRQTITITRYQDRWFESCFDPLISDVELNEALEEITITEKV